VARIDQVLAGEKSWGKYALDVLGHAAIGLGASLPAVIPGVLLGWPAWLTLLLGELLALTAGALRERAQYKKSGKLHLLDRVLDTAHHVLGPPIAFGLVHMVVALAT